MLLVKRLLLLLFIGDRQHPFGKFQFTTGWLPNRGKVADLYHHTITTRDKDLYIRIGIRRLKSSHLPGSFRGIRLFQIEQSWIAEGLYTVPKT